MSNGITIPKIAITPESNEWSSTNNIADNLTDVEDLEETKKPNKIKSNLKIKLVDIDGTTDVEDLEGSDQESDIKIPTVSFKDLHLDDSNYEENTAGTVGNMSQSCKTAARDLLYPSADEGVTDVENMDTDHELQNEEIPDPDINFDDYQSDQVNISTNLKQQSENLNLPKNNSNQLTDIESLDSDDDKKISQKKSKPRRRKSKGGCYKSKECDGSDGKWKQCKKMKKSFSHPVALSQQESWAAFESDEELNDTKFFDVKIQKKNLTENRSSSTDNSQNTDEITVAKKKSVESDTDIEFLEGEREDLFKIIEIILPPPVRNVIILSENKSLVPTAKILPLDESGYLEWSNEELGGGVTDTEVLADDDDLLDVASYNRGPTPDVFFYENSDISYGESQLKPPRNNIEPTTDTEDLAVDDRPKRVKKIKNKSLAVEEKTEAALTDTEDFYFSDSTRSSLKRQIVVQSSEDRCTTPYYIKEMNGTIVCSKDSHGSSSTKKLLNITKPKILTTSPNITDVEDLAASADEDYQMTVDNSKEFSQHLEQQRSSRVHIENTRKLNFDSPNEIMYLKGGAYYQNHTDIEEISDDNGSVNMEKIREWDVSKKSASQEEASLPQGAEQQAPNYITYESVLLRPDREISSSPTLSYKEIDAMLEKMLVEVEKQEKLFSLDLDVLEPNDDSYVNTLELVPDTGALIEIPIKKTPVFESYREIQIESDHEDCDSDEDEPLANFLINRPKIASNESLTDPDDDDDYEPIEYNALAHIYQRFDTIPTSDIWFEGTYRNLSIVPEEDEDESTSLLSSYSNFRTYSTSSNQYSLHDFVPLPEQTESDCSDSESTSDSDLDDQPGTSESIVKAEVKLLVKTTDHGKEAIEIRSVREFLETPPEKLKTTESKKKSQLGDKFNSLKSKFNSIVDRGKRNLNLKTSEENSRENLIKDEKKPTFTLQQLFVRTPEPIEGSLQESKRFGSRNELVANSSEKFPLVHDPEVPLGDDEVIKEIGAVDLYANIPFYPCYNRSNLSQYGLKTVSSPHTNPFTETTSSPFSENDQIPRAYCDWLEDKSGGLSTTTERLVASNEDTLLDKPLGQQLTGLSVTDDTFIFDLKTVCEQTNAFIQSESQPEPYDALADKYTRKEPINEKKVDDNKNNMNEKKKAKKGFFGSIKTFVERSFESDSESEKSPKKSKKPKKDKKKKPKDETTSGESSLPPRKPKLPTPPLEPIDIDTIPFAEASVNDIPPPYKPPDIPSKEQPIPVTDLDADLEVKPVQIEKTEIVTTQKEPEKLHSKDVDEKEKSKKEKPKEKEKKKIKGKTIIVEEVTKTIEPLVIEAEEFSIIVDPTKKESPKKCKETFTVNIDESIEKKEKEILEKSPILSEEKIIKPIAALEMQADTPIRPPRVKDHIYEDIESSPVSLPQDKIKEITTDLIQNEINFGAWSDVSAGPERLEKEEESQKEIIEKQDKEILKEKESKSKTEDAESKKKEEKKGGFFGLFKKKDSRKEDEPVIEKVEKDQKPSLSEAVVKDMDDSRQFLVDEVENYHDVRTTTTTDTTVTETVVTTTTTAKPDVEETKQESEGFFSLFKKPKKEESVDKKAKKEEKASDKKTDTLERKLKKEESVDKKSKKEEKTVVEKKADTLEKKLKKEDSVDKKSKKDEKKVAVILSQEVLRNILDSKRFLEGEVQNYNDVRPQEEPVVATEEFSTITKSAKTEIETSKETVTKKPLEEQKEPSSKHVIDEKKDESPKRTDDKKESSPKPSPGFFGLFKKSKKDETEAESKPILSEKVLEEMKNTDQFLVCEVENYHDVKPTTEETKTQIDITEAKAAGAIETQSSSFLGLFKKGKKEEETQPIKSTLPEAVEDKIDAKQILSGKGEKYDTGPITEKSSEEEKLTESAEQPSSGFFGLFKKTKKEDEKIVVDASKETVEIITETVTDVDKGIKVEEDKIKKVVEEVRESSPKPAGFFGLFKKSKKDEEETVPTKPPLSDSVVKDMDDTNQFLSTEVNKYQDVKPEKFELIQEEKVKLVEASPKPSKGVFGIFKKPKKDEEVPIPETIVSESIAKDVKKVEEQAVAETEKLTKAADEETESFSKSRGIFGIFKKGKKEQEESDEAKPLISEAVIQDMKNTNMFLMGEITNYHDVKPEKFDVVVEEKVTKIEEESAEASPKPSRGLFGIFKKSKKDQEDSVESKPTISETVQKEMSETDTFLTVEVKQYEDVKPVVEETTSKVQEEIESSIKPSKGLFGIFKKSKKSEEEDTTVKPDLSEIPAKEIETTTEFITAEVQVYDDVKPEKFEALVEEIKDVQKPAEAPPKPARGLFGIFKTSMKDKEESGEAKSALSEETVKNITDSSNFLSQEVDKYHDVKPEKFESAVEEKATKMIEETTESSPKPSRGIFGIFKSPKKDKDEPEEVKPVALSEETLKNITDSSNFLNEEVQKYHDVKPEKFEPVTEEKATKMVEQTTESSPKPSRGLFGIFKSPKKDKDEVQETKADSSDEIAKNISDSSKFSTEEVQKYHDMKPDTFETVGEDKVTKIVEETTEASPKLSRGLFGIFKSPKKDKDESGESKPTLSEETVKTITDTTKFLTDEVQNYHDVKPEKFDAIVEQKVSKTVEESVEGSPKPSRGLFGIFKSPKKDKDESIESKPHLTEEIIKTMSDTTAFLSQEIEDYHDVKPEQFETLEEEKLGKTVQELSETSKPSRGLFGIFKTSKKDKEESAEQKSTHESVKTELDTSTVLTEEVQNNKDAKSFIEEKVVKTEEPKEPKESTSRPTSGIFGIFKKSKKDEIEYTEITAPVTDTDQKTAEAVKEIEVSEAVSTKENQPKVSEEKVQTILKTESEEIEPKQEVKVGFLSKFKITKKKPSLIETQLSEEVRKSIDETNSFLSTEVNNYEDEKVKVIDKDKKEEKSVTFEATKSKMVLEGHLPQPEVAQVVEVIKTDITDQFKEADEKVSEVQDVTLQEAKEIQQAVEQVDSSNKRDKDKQGKDKKGFFHRFGKKSKSQETSFEEPRERSIDEGESSPKKQKRRKSSSPFKFFEKMKKSEEDVKVKEIEETPLPKTEEEIKATSEQDKDDSLNVEFEDQPMNLSEEVLSSLEKKMEELKSKYTPEVQKQLNDCRDFLFIEVDNYDDSKAVVITDIDTGVTTDATKAVDDIIDKAAKVVEDTKKEADAATKEVVEPSLQAVTQAEEATKKATKKKEKAERKSGGFFSKLGNLISGSVDEAKSELKEARKSAEKVVITAKESVEKSLDTAAIAAQDKASKAKDKVQETQKTVSEKAADTKDKLKELQVSSVKVTQETVDEVSTIKDHVADSTAQKVEDTKQELALLKESLLEVKAKTGEKVSDLKKGTVEKTKTAVDGLHEIKDEAAKKLDDTKKDISDKIDESKSEVKQSVESTKEAVDKKLQGAKDAAEEAAVKVQDSVQTVVDTSAQKVSDFKKETSDVVTQQKQEFDKTKEAATEKISDAKKDTKTFLEKGKESVVGGIGKMFGTTKEKTDAIAKTKDDALEQASQEVKQIKQETQERMQKITDTATEKYEAVGMKLQIAKDTTKEAAVKVQESVQTAVDTSAQKVSDFKKKTSDVVEQQKEEFDKTKQIGAEKISDVKKDTKTFLEKGKESVVGGIGKMFGTTKEKTDAIAKTKDDALEQASQEVEQIKQETQESMQKVTDTATEKYEAVGMKLQIAKDTTKEAAVKVQESVQTAVDTSAQKVSDFKKKTSDVVEQQKEEFDKTKQIGAEKISDVKKDTKTFLEKGKESVVGGIGKMFGTTKEKTDAIAKTKDDALEQASQEVEQIKQETQERMQKVTDTATEKYEAVGMKLQIAKDTTKEAAVKVQESVQTAVDTSAQKVSDFKKETSDVVEQQKEEFDKTKQTGAEKISDVKKDTKTFLEKGKESVVGGIGKMFGTAKEKTDAIAKTKDDALEKASHKVEQIKQETQEKAQKITDKATEKYEVAVTTGDQLKADIKTKATQKLEETEKIAAATTDKLKEGVESTKESVKAQVENLQDTKKKIEATMGTTYTKATDELSKKVESVKNKTSEEIGKTKENLEDTFTGVKDSLQKAADQKVEEMKRTKDSLESAVVTKVDEIKTATSEKVSELEQAKKDVADVTLQKIDNVQKTKDDAKEAILKKSSEVKDLLNQKAEHLAQAKESVKDATQQKIEQIVAATTGKVEEKGKAVQETIIQKAEEVSKVKEDVKSATATKAEDFAAVASQKIDTLKQVKQDVKDSTVEKVHAASEAISGKIDNAFKAKTKLEEDVQKKSQDFVKSTSEKIDESKTKIETETLKKTEQLREVTDDISKLKETIQEGAATQLSQLAGRTKEIVTSKAEDLSKTATKKVEEIEKTKQTVTDVTESKLDDLTKAAAKKIDDISKVKDDVKKIVGDKTEGISKTTEDIKEKVEDKISDIAKTTSEKVDDLHKAKEEIAKSLTQPSEEVSKAKESLAKESKSVAGSLTVTAGQKLDNLRDVKEGVQKTLSQKIEATSEKLSTEKDKIVDDAAKTAKQLKEEIAIAKTQTMQELEKSKDSVTAKVDEVAQEMTKAKEVAEQKLVDVMSQQVDEINKAKEATKEKGKDIAQAATQKIDEKTKIVENISSKATDDLQKAKYSATQKIDKVGKGKDSLHEDLTKLQQSVQDTSAKIKEELTITKKGVSADIARAKTETTKKIEEKLKDSVDKSKEETASKMSDLEDQLAKLTSSLEQLTEPVVTEVEKVKSYVTSPIMKRRSESQRISREERPIVREVKTGVADEDSDEEHYTVTEPEDHKKKKRKPLFHLESEEDDGVDASKLKDRRDSVRSNVLETLSENKLDNLLNDLEDQLVKDLEKSVTETKEITETKLSKAESDLEAIKKDSQADVEQIEQKLRDLDKALDSLEQASDPKLEKKLHRVERKFERMASEVMDKDVSGVSPTEVEARREHEFQRLVSQLSTEEVSDFQKEYSHLWDETTFSKSDDWDSKTPDSQVDVQELPQGEVVYMGPVTLNKDNLVNKAGIEVDVIPIMRSPCHTPRPTKKNKRAKSAMDFYEESSPPKEFDRGSLPDLKGTSLKGSLVSTIIQLNSDRFLYGSTTSLRSTASSGSDLSKGEIMNAVLDWLDKSNRMNESSASFETASIASSDSNLSQFSAKTNPSVPTIRITKGNGKKRSKRKGQSEQRETTCAPTLTEELKTIPQPKPRFAKETPLQFKEDKPQPKLEKQISPVRDDLLDDDEQPILETYSDKKKFWENVTKDKRMSLNETTTIEKELTKKRTSIHEVPVPKPRSQVQVSQSIEEMPPSIETETPEERIMSEYQASFQPPKDRKSKTPPKVESDKESTDSESDNLAHSGTNENVGYISDSGDVEHYISDSEIEDRVPQIRERQMSVFAPPVAAARKTIYERSASLPTEDLYEVSARSVKLRKQYYEEQIKKEMIEEQLTSELEEEPSPERKTLISSLIDQQSEEKVTVTDIARSFDEATKKEVSFESEFLTHKPDKVITHFEDPTPISQQISETHKEIDVDSQARRSPLGSEQSSSSDIDKITRNESTSKPDSMEVHVDKSEIEDPEKLADFDQDATDLETKSLDSLNAAETSPKSATFVDEAIPEITVTLSGKQRRISEESDEYAPKADKKHDLDSPINVPEEHLEDTVWEVSVQSQPEAQFDEKVTSFDAATVEKIEKDEDLSLSTRDESDLGSEIHQDHSDSFSDKIKSESHSDIERIIMDSLQHQKVDPIEAKAIASALIEEIEAEIHRRECLPPTTTTGDVSDYLKYLAETKGLDEREVELVESVLARRQRELAKLSRGDTQASSIEITDEDLRYSGTELDSSHILEQQISQLKAEKIDDIKSMTFLDKIDEKHTEETHSSKDYETFEDGITTGVKSEIHTKSYESIKGERIENKDTILEEDETISETTTQEDQEVETRIEAVTVEDTHKKTEDKEVDDHRKTSVDISKEKTSRITSTIAEIDSEEVHKKKMQDDSLERDVTKSIIKHQIDLSEKSPTEEMKLKGEITCEDYRSSEETTQKETTSEIKEVQGVSVEKAEATEKSHMKTVEKEVVDKETEEKCIHKDEDTIIKQSKISSKVTSTDIVRESSKVTEVTEKIEVLDFEPSLLPSDLEEVKTIVAKHEEIKRTSSSDSKSSIESGKSPEEQFSTCSSGRKGDSDSSKAVEKQEVLMRKTGSVAKGDRKSGIEFETYSSSGESHYHSFELDSGKSRPCSSDVEGLVAAGSSEYESALTSQDISSRSHVTSAEYHTAVSSLSSKESMKSLDSESSGHLGSVEVSELSETLVPSASDAEGDILDAVDQMDDGPWNDELDDERGDNQSKMKRSHEMTFQPELKMLSAESPQTDELDKKFTSMDDGSIVSMSLSSTSGTEPRTVIELSRADSERIEGGSMSVSGISDQLSIEGSCDSLVFHPPTSLTTTDMSTSTGHTESNLQIESITFTTSVVHESGIRSVSTQVTSESHTPEEDRTTKPEEPQMNGKCPPEVKKKTHRRQESTSSFVPQMLAGFDQKFHSDLAESDKYTTELSLKEVISDEKKDIDEREKEESYETEADQGFHRDIREGKYQETEEEIKDDTPEFSSETQASVGELEQEYSSALARAQEVKKKSDPSPDFHLHKEQLEKRDSHGKSSGTSSEKSSFEEAEAEAAFNMVAHVSPAHKIKQICPILEDEDAEKHELETRERAQKEYEKRRSQMRDQSPGSIPDIKVTQHMTPLVDRNFHYPDLELEEQEREKEKEQEKDKEKEQEKDKEKDKTIEKEKEAEAQKSTPQTPSSKSSEDTDQGREYILEDSGISIPEDATTESKSTVIEQTVKEEADKDTDSPNSDSFEMLEKPDLIDDFVVIEEVAKEAQEFDSEGKSVNIQQKTSQKRGSKKHDEEVEAYLTKSAPTPLTRMTDVKFYPDGSSSEELGFDFEDSPPINNEASASTYEKELEANKKWIEQQFQGDQAARMAAGYDYEMEFERGPLEDIKEEDINDFDPTSSRIGSLGSQKESGGSLGSVKDSYSSTPEYDVLAGRKYFTRSGEHDDISMNSLQEFENLERAMSLETKRYHQGSQDSSSNGSFKTRYYASKSGQGDDVSVSSLKEFEGLEMACIAAHKIEVKAKEEEAMLAQIDEGQESIASESESCETVSRTDKKIIPDSDEEDYEKRMFEIDEIIRQAQSNVERFIDLKEAEKTESLGRGDSIEEVSKVPDLDLDTPVVRSTIKVQWKEGENVMVTSVDSIEAKDEEKGSHNDSTDSLDQKTCADVMTASTDSIEFQAKKSEPINLFSDSIEIKDEACGMISSDSLELAAKQSENNLESTDSIVDPTSSTATHATYQYETDSVFSGSFTSGGSNTMVSSTDTIDPVQVDIAAAARKVWFDEDTGSSRKFTTEYLQDSGKPYVTEVIEPCDDDGFSHTIHRRVELPPEVKKVTFYGSDADERLKQFIEDFNEGEHIEEVQEVDAAGNVHTKRVVQRRFIIEGPETKEFIEKTVASKTNQLTSFPKETTGEESSFAATGSQDSGIKAQTTRRRQLRYEISVDDQIEVDPREHDWRFNLPEHAEGEESGATGSQDDRTSTQQRSIADQHQLSEEMKQLLKELEKESKQ